MTAAEKQFRATPKEYLDYLEGIEGKAEYHNGEIFDMAGGSRNHAAIAANILGLLWAGTRGGACAVKGSDLKVRIEASNSYVFPDISVTCGPDDGYDPADQSISKPKLIVEVLSPSTAGFDRGGKFKRYRTLPSLEEYVVVEQEMMLVDVFHRDKNGDWMMRSYFRPEAVVVFDSLGLQIAISAVYAGVELPEEKRD
jgi:Uma2 family endonuclease